MATSRAGEFVAFGAGKNSACGGEGVVRVFMDLASSGKARRSGPIVLIEPSGEAPRHLWSGSAFPAGRALYAARHFGGRPSPSGRRVTLFLSAFGPKN